MLKKFLFTSFLCLPSSVFAAGFYLGLGAGPDVAKFETNATVSQFQQGHASFNVKDKNELSGIGAFGSIFAGYGKSFQIFHSKPNIYIAAELNANLSTLEHDSSNYEYIHHTFSDTQFTIKRSFAASILPGILFTESSLFYGRLGYANGNFEITSTDVSIGNLNRNLNGFRWGLGFQQSITSRLAGRLEFSQISYENTHGFTHDPISNTNKLTSFKPITNEFEFGLLYYFC